MPSSAAESFYSTSSKRYNSNGSHINNKSNINVTNNNNNTNNNSNDSDEDYAGGRWASFARGLVCGIVLGAAGTLLVLENREKIEQTVSELQCFVLFVVFLLLLFVLLFSFLFIS